MAACLCVIGDLTENTQAWEEM